MFHLMPFENNDRSFFNYLDNFEKNFFGGFPMEFSQFRTDILDEGDHFLLQAELPGFQKEDITIDLQNSMLTIKAEHNETNEVKKDNFVRKERKSGSYARSFDISNVKAEEIEAAYQDGVLELKLPKKELTVPTARRIDIK